MFALTNLAGFGAASGSASLLSVTKTDQVGSGSNATSYTFSTRAIGTASADRYIIVCWALQQLGGGISDVPTITVGGAACTSLGSQATATAARTGIAITSAPFTSGTTAEIIVNEGSTQHSCEITLFSVTGLASLTPFDTLGNNSTPATGQIDCDAGGFIIGTAVVETDATTFSWTNLTESSDLSDGDSITHSTAFDLFASAQTNRTITATPAAGSTTAMFAVALK